MNRTDRLLALILELQRGGIQSAAQLAATFETSKRTIYRDVLALAEAGVPIISTPGRGYGLDEGYFLPPLRFTTDEATLLLLGSDFMADNFDAQYCATAQTAGRKIEAVLSKERQADVAYLRQNIHFVTLEAMSNPAALEKLRGLRSAIIARQTVRFRYHARRSQSGELDTAREVDPYAIAFMSGAWYVTGHDHLRHAHRTFRLDRIESFSVLSKTFIRPKDFHPERRDDDRQLVVRVLLDPEAARWAQEARPYYWVEEIERPDGLLMTLRVRQLDDIVGWILSWGRQARVLEPEALKQRLAEEARQVRQLYSTEGTD